MDVAWLSGEYTAQTVHGEAAGSILFLAASFSYLIFAAQIMGTEDVALTLKSKVSSFHFSVA